MHPLHWPTQKAGRTLKGPSCSWRIYGAFCRLSRFPDEGYVRRDGNDGGAVIQAWKDGAIAIVFLHSWSRPQARVKYLSSSLQDEYSIFMGVARNRMCGKSNEVVRQKGRKLCRKGLLKIFLMWECIWLYGILDIRISKQGYVSYSDLLKMKIYDRFRIIY